MTATGSRYVESIADVLDERIATHTDHLAFSWLEEDGSTTEVTYAELLGRAAGIEAAITRIAATGDRAVLLYVPGLEFVAAFVACLWSGVVAVPVYPPLGHRAIETLQGVAADCDPAVFLVESEGEIAAVGDMLPGCRASIVASTSINPATPAPHRRDADDLALLQYTSGSTGAPKGVMVTHGNLLHNQEVIASSLRHKGDERIVSWLPMYHDMGLIGSVMQSIYLGAPCWLMSPLTFLRRPLTWLETLSRVQGTTSAAPNFAFDLCSRRATPDAIASLDLSHWRVALSGGEPVRAATIRRFAEVFAPCGFREEAFSPAYGLAEATLMVSVVPPGVRPRVRTLDDGREVVSCGQPSGQRVVVVDDDGREMIPGEVGELAVCGDSVTAGYWHRPEETNEVFPSGLAGCDRALRTGDLGFVADGEVYVCGRRRDLIIIRGRNHFPQDIEQTVEDAHEAIRPGCSAAVGVDTTAEEALVVVAEVSGDGADVAGVTDAIQAALVRDHGLRASVIALVRARTILKTSSGKIRRSACRDAFILGELDLYGQVGTLDPNTRNESATIDRVRAVVARVLDLRTEEIDSDRVLATLGLDSLGSLEVQDAIEAELGVEVSIEELLGDATAASIAAALSGGSAPATGAAAALDTGAATLAERGLWFLDKWAAGTPAYTIRRLFAAEDGADVDALARAFALLVARWPALRSMFVRGPEGPVRVIAPPGEWRPEVVHAAALEDARRAVDGAANAGFDLEAGPLMRVVIATAPGARPLVLVALHHIIADFWALSMLVRELGVLYQAERLGVTVDLPQPKLTMADAASAEAALVESPQGEELVAYWSEVLRGATSGLDLPLDRPRPPVRTFAGSAVRFGVDEGTTSGLVAVAERAGATPFAVALAGYVVMLYRYTGQDDIVVGCPTVGRPSRAMRSIMGHLVNTVPVRVRVDLAAPFEALVRDVASAVTGALRHAAYPLPKLVDRLAAGRSASRTPLFETLFTFEQATDDELTAIALEIDGATLDAGGLRLECVPLPPTVAHFDLDAVAGITGGRLVGTLVYSTDIFDEQTTARMVADLERILRRAATAPDEAVSRIAATVDEPSALANACIGPMVDDPPAERLDAMFERQVAARSAAIAIEGPDGSITYAELDDAATAAACAIAAAGGSRTGPVGLLLPPTPDVVAAMIGAWRAKRAFVPLDPALPDDRLAVMIDSSEASVILADEATRERAEALAARCTDPPAVVDPSDEHQGTTPPTGSDDVDHVAYIVYTSGSTGVPKGVPITHRNVAPLLLWQEATFGHGPGSRFMQTLSLSFDFGLQEVFNSVLTGGTLVMRPVGVAMLAPVYCEHVTTAGATTLYLTPSYADELVAYGAAMPSVSHVLLGGEVLKRSTVEALRRLVAPGCTIVNGYGPSEASINCAMHVVAPTQDDTHIVPIGTATGASRLYVLDRLLQPVPVGVFGELCIGGIGVASGYIGEQGRIEELFVADPFVPSERMYRSGDRARLRSDGLLEVVGRLDSQVKLRGYRVELEEIEAVMRSTEMVSEVVAVVDPRSASRVVALASIADGVEPTEVRTAVARVLPQYMVPSLVLPCAELPKTQNGKVDRTAAARLLPSLRPRPAKPASQTEAERAVAGAWALALGVDEVDVSENVFDLGGHSLMVSLVHADLEERLGCVFPLHALFEHPTVRDLARFLGNGADSASDIRDTGRWARRVPDRWRAGFRDRTT